MCYNSTSMKTVLFFFISIAIISSAVYAVANSTVKASQANTNMVLAEMDK